MQSHSTEPVASAIDHQETIWSEVFPGNRHTAKCLPDALKGVQSSLEPAIIKQALAKLFLL